MPDCRKHVEDPASFVLDLPRRDTTSKQVNGKELSMKRPIFPFSAILGQDQMKKSLIYNAIDPSIGGVLIRGQKETAKSTAVRGMAELLPERLVVKGCPFSCYP